MCLSDTIAIEDDVTWLFLVFLIKINEELFDELIHALNVLCAMGLDAEHRRVTHAPCIGAANHL